MFDILAIWLQHQCERALTDVRGARELAMLADDIGISADALEDAAGKADGDLQHLESLLRMLDIDQAALGRAEKTLLRDLEQVWGLKSMILDIEEAEDLTDLGFAIPYVNSVPFWSPGGKPTLH